jgi:tRNA threonylcarbamoyladenosine biosynthesis protein TsaE
MIRTITTTSEAGTEEVGRELAAGLTPGTIVLLHGNLGAGKTAFVRGLAAGMGIDPDEVSSPTFTLVQEYHGDLPLYHADLYRLSPGEVPDLGLEELSLTGVVAVEWAEKWPHPGGAVIEVRLEHAGDTARTIVIAAPDEANGTPGTNPAPGAQGYSADR